MLRAKYMKMVGHIHLVRGHIHLVRVCHLWEKEVCHLWVKVCHRWEKEVCHLWEKEVCHQWVMEDIIHPLVAMGMGEKTMDLCQVRGTKVTIHLLVMEVCHR
tara:strand:+ start:152 stop:457 length:306 start_codon:yes stop_codon:yes gene_type:complete